MIQDRLLQVRDSIAQICRRMGKEPKDITLIGVTKFASIPAIKEAIDCGLTDIGESRVQAAGEKFPALTGTYQRVVKHMIGHLQTNKAKQAVQIFDMIQSVDSLRLAQEIDRHARASNKVMEVLLQVNISGEQQKFGMEKDTLFPLLDDLKPLSALRVRGLMTIAPLVDAEAPVRECFRALRTLFEAVAKEYAGAAHITMKHLSMGMTDDYHWALEEGANMVRIGRAIFSE